LSVVNAVADAVIKWAASRATQPPRVGAAYMAGQTQWPEWDTVKAITEGYKVSYILYAVASDIADCIRSVPWQVKKQTKTGAEILDTHPLNEMIRSPNTEGTWGALLEAFDLYKSLAGNAYGLWSQTTPGNIDIWSWRPDRVAIVPDKKGNISSYSYYVPGEASPTSYKPEEVLHFKFFDPGSDHYGMAPLQAAARLVDTSNAGLKWNWASMENRARPDLVLAPKNSLEENQFNKFLELLKERITGPQNAHNILIPSQPMDVMQLSLTPVEMDFLQSFLTYEVGVCKVFHVHPEAIGTLGATFENKKWALRAKWEGPVVSRLSEMRAVFNHKFRLPFGTADPKIAKLGDIFLDYDLSQTPIAEYQQGKAIERATKVWACGVPWNVAAATFGVSIEPVEGGDVGYLPANLLPASSPVSGRSQKRSMDERQVALWRAIDQYKQGWERGVEIKVKAVFAAQAAEVVKAVEGGTLDTDAVINKSNARWSELISSVLQGVIEDFGGRQAVDLGGISSGRSITDGFIELINRADPVYTFDPYAKNVQNWVHAKTAADIDGIQATTQQAIRHIVLEGIDEGWAVTKTARAIREQFDLWENGIGVSRSATIARTEVHTAAGYGMHESAKQSGIVTKKFWSNSGDERVRDLHIENTGAGWIGMDEAYPSGAMYPGGGGPEDSVNCRCAELYETKRGE